MVGARQSQAGPRLGPASSQVAFRLDFEFSKTVFLHHLQIQLSSGRSGACACPTSHFKLLPHPRCPTLNPTAKPVPTSDQPAACPVTTTPHSWRLGDK
jgi:hypothetical protein